MSSQSNFVDALRTKPYLVLDGALATELERKGCNLNCKLWSAQVLADDPDLIYQVHVDYFVAGADVAITSTYQASVQGLMEAGHSDTEAVDLIHKSVGLAARARREINLQDRTRVCYIAGSVGPYGAYLSDGSEYRGDYKLSFDDMKDFHRPRIVALLDAHVDVLACETIPSIEEIKAILSLLDDFTAPAWISVTLKDGQHLSDGTPLSTVAKILDESENIVAMGLNCVSAELVDEALQQFSSQSSKPFVVYPNSGEGFDATSKTWTGNAMSSNSLAELVTKWHANGAKLIGGCCRTAPSDIKIVKEILKNHKSIAG
jgi:homocysteine S-methyltransferase